MPIQVEALGTRFEFPDGTPRAEIELAIDSHFSKQNGISPVIDQAIKDRQAQDEAIRQEQAQQAQDEARRSVASELSPLQAGVVAAGGSFLDLVRGVQQIGLENLPPELFGMTPQDAAQKLAELERQVESEKGAREALREEKPVASFVGEVAGQSFIPAFGGKAALTRVLGGALTAGLTEAAQFTPAEEDRLDNALKAAGFGAGFSGLTEAAKPLFRAAINKAKGRIGSDDIAEIVEAGRQQGIDVLPADISDSPAARTLTQAAEKVPVVGTAGVRINQAQQQRRAATALMETISEGAAPSQVEEEILEGLKRSVQQNKQRARTLFNRAGRALDPEGPIQLSKAKAKALEMIDEERLLGSKADRAIIDELQKIADLPDLNFSGTRQIRSRIGADIADIYSGKSSVLGSEAAAKLQQVKNALEDDLADFSEKIGNDEGMKAFRAANRFYAENLSPFREGALKRVIDQDDPKAALNFLTAAGKEGGQKRAAQLFNALDIKGKKAVRAGVIQKALEAGLPQEGAQGVFSANKFATELDRNQKLINQFFTPQEKKTIQGLRKVMRATARAGQTAEDPPTGARLVGLAILGGSAISPEIAGTTAALAAAARMTLANPKLAELYAQASSTAIDSPRMRKIIEEIEKRVGPQIARELSELEGAQ